MKLTNALTEVIKENKIDTVFGLQGGAVVHIFDSLEKGKVKVLYTHHEQTASLAAVANSKITGKLGCVVVTTGPACTNAMTGLLSAWQDSVPVIFISGQARSSHMSYNKKVRQVGTQEVNICDIVKPITKYRVVINNPKNFLYEFRKAIYIANTGRKGPVWIDLPLEHQWSDVNYKPLNKLENNLKNNKIKKNIINHITKLINVSVNPLIILGYGLRSSKLGIIELKKFVEKNNLPFVTTWNAADIFPTYHKLNLGIIGMSGQRGANKKVFNSDLILCLGTHLSIPHTTTLYSTYAQNAKKIIVNIDHNQLKNLNIKFDIKVQSDVGEFLKKINSKKINKIINTSNKYYKNLNWYEPKKYPGYINSNYVVRQITKNIKNKCIIVDGGGTALYSGFQSSIIYRNDRIICSSAISSMGTGLAETIGSCKSDKFKKYICIIGDGSYLMNIQDLQSISEFKKKILILLINNNGYLAIRHTQKEFLSSKFYGTHPKWKLKMPNFEKVTKSFNIKYVKIKTLIDFNSKLNTLTNVKHPTVCEIITSENQESLFKQGYKKNLDGTFAPMTLEEMHPFTIKPISNTNN